LRVVVVAAAGMLVFLLWFLMLLFGWSWTRGTKERRTRRLQAARMCSAGRRRADLFHGAVDGRMRSLRRQFHTCRSSLVLLLARTAELNLVVVSHHGSISTATKRVLLAVRLLAASDDACLPFLLPQQCAPGSALFPPPTQASGFPQSTTLLLGFRCSQTHKRAGAPLQPAMLAGSH